MDNIKILAIVGSLRENSYNRQLAKAAIELLPEGVEMKILDYSDIPYMNQDLESPEHPVVKRIRDEVVEADALWIFTPEYNHSIPGVLKNLIDWLSRPREDGKNVLSGKKVAISGTTPGGGATFVAQDMLIIPLAFLNMKIMNQPRLAIPNIMNQTDEDGNLKLTDSEEYLQKQVDAFVEFIKN